MTQNNTRYDRQTLLPEIGKEGQTRLNNARVLVVGAGGLGCPALQYLAGAGIGHIGICDDDTVEESNLHRQTLYSVADIGLNKAHIAKEKLTRFNPEILLTAYDTRVDEQNAETLFADYDIIFDGTDNFKTKFLINDICVKLGKPFVYGAVLGFNGQVALLNDNEDAPNLRWLFPHPPQNHIPNCAENGVLGASAGFIGTLQALECLKFIIASPELPPAKNTILNINLRTLDISKLLLTQPLQPSIQDEHTATETLDMSDLKTLDAANLETHLSNTANAVLVDVREHDEWDAGYINGAELFPMSAFLEEGATPKWDKNVPLILYCRSGKRSEYVGETLIAQGYTDVTNMIGGILAWKEKTLKAA